MDDKQILQNIVKQIKNYFTERHDKSQKSIAMRIREYWIGIIRQTLIKQYELHMGMRTSEDGLYEFFVLWIRAPDMVVLYYLILNPKIQISLSSNNFSSFFAQNY